MKRLAIVVVLVALLLVACGKPSQVYSLDKTESCLRGKGLHLGGPLDFVATTATGGAVRVRLRDNLLTLVFGETTGDADNINAAYRRFHAKNVGIDDVLRQQGNAVMLWRTHPSDADIAVLTGCLK